MISMLVVLTLPFLASTSKANMWSDVKGVDISLDLLGKKATKPVAPSMNQMQGGIYLICSNMKREVSPMKRLWSSNHLVRARNLLTLVCYCPRK